MSTVPLKEFSSSARRYTVVVPEGNGYSDPQNISRIADHFQQLGIDAEFEMEDGIAVQNDQGAYTLIARDDVSSGKASLIVSSHYGLKLIPA